MKKIIANDNDGQVTLSMGKDEALVLFEMLSEFIDQSIASNTVGGGVVEVKHPGEYVAINRLVGCLEPKLVELLCEDYNHHVELARDRLKASFFGNDTGK